ncbi:Sensor histidine kinase YdfH [Trichinella pseudospiralis]
MSARCLDAGPTWKAVDDRKIVYHVHCRGVSHWLVLSRPCHKAALTVRKTHFVHVDIKAKTGISIAAAGSTFIHHLRNQDQGHLSADHSDNDLLPSASTLRTTAG